MLFETLSQTLANLHQMTQEIALDIQKLINEIPLSHETSTLPTTIQTSLRNLHTTLELTEQQVQDLLPGQSTTLLAQKGVLEGSVRRLWTTHTNLTHSFRRAQLIASRNLEEVKKKQRERLVHSYRNVGKEEYTTLFGSTAKSRDGSKKDSRADRELNASSAVTLSLRRTHALLSEELSRSQFAHEMLEESTAALSGLGTNYSDLDSLLKISRGYLGSLMRSQKSDSWYLTTAFWILAATCIWLVFRRLIFGPTMAFIFLFIRLPWRVLRTTGLMEGGPMGFETTRTRGSLIPSSIATGTSIDIPVATVDRQIISQEAAYPSPDGVESMMVEVGKIIDASNVDSEQHPNTKKRMWEEESKANPPIHDGDDFKKEWEKDEL